MGPLPFKVVAVYVDDIVITGISHEITSFKDMLSTKFKCNDLGLCQYLLRLEIDTDERAHHHQPIWIRGTHPEEI